MLQPRRRSLYGALLPFLHTVLFLVYFPSSGLAARLGGSPNPNIETDSSRGSAVKLDLSPILTAVFSFYIVFTIVTAVQSWRVWLRMRLHNQQTQTMAYMALFIGTVLIFLHYILGAVYVSNELTTTALASSAAAIESSTNSGDASQDAAPPKRLSDAFHAIRMFTDQGFDFLLYLSTFLILHFRASTLLPTGTAGNNHPITWADFTVPMRRLLFATVTFFIFLVFIVVGSGLRGSWREVTETDGKQDIVVKSVFIIYQFYVAWACVVGVFLETVALSIWIFLGREKVHDSIINRLSLRIIPLLLLRSLLRLSTNIAESLPANSPYVNAINYEAVMLIDVLVSALVAAIVMWSLVSLGCPYSRAYPVPVPQAEPEAPPPPPPPMEEVAPPPPADDPPPPLMIMAMPEPQLAPPPMDGPPPEGDNPPPGQPAGPPPALPIVVG
ncbi:hypothetical protein AX16_005740 [Volvariella volvacea WC 439]|nr:hypothetical protein AX16_005740 [Volvariella volvacea WC 439]